MDWNHTRFEIIAITELVDKIEKYILPYSDFLVVKQRKHQELLLDYAMHFMKANGSTRRKVFKLRKIALSPLERVKMSGAVSFADMITRRHYPGDHRIELLINGIPHPLGEFKVRR